MAGADAQEATIRRVLDAHCIWQLLGLQPTLHQPEAVLKKPVMQLYLLIHPDKCDHPDATLAFQHLSNLMDASQKPGHKKPTGSSKKRSRPSSPPKPPPPPPRGTPGDEWFSDADDDDASPCGSPYGSGFGHFDKEWARDAGHYSDADDGDNRCDDGVDGQISSEDWRSWFPDLFATHTFVVGASERPSWLSSGKSDPLLVALAEQRDRSRGREERAAKRVKLNATLRLARAKAAEDTSSRLAVEEAAEAAYHEKRRVAQELARREEEEVQRARREAQLLDEERKLRLHAEEKRAKQAERASQAARQFSRPLEEEQAMAAMRAEMVVSTQARPFAGPSSAASAAPAGPPASSKLLNPRPSMLLSALGPAFAAVKAANPSTPLTPVHMDTEGPLRRKPDASSFASSANEYVEARGRVADAAALIGPSGQRLNALREKYPRTSIQLTNGDERELILRGPRSDVAELVSSLRVGGQVRIAMPPTTTATKRTAAYVPCETGVPKVQLAGPFIQAARGEVDIVRAATTALSMARADAVPAPVHEKYAAAPTASDTTASMLQRPRPKAGATHGNGRSRGPSQCVASRKRVPWTPSEERALRVGVQEHGLGKWQAILLGGGFHACRTNVDLKDKARNMKL